jgi:hypothetical protein
MLYNNSLSEWSSGWAVDLFGFNCCISIIRLLFLFTPISSPTPLDDYFAPFSEIRLNREELLVGGWWRRPHVPLRNC